jgi:hypothetical protein
MCLDLFDAKEASGLGLYISRSCCLRVLLASAKTSTEEVEEYPEHGHERHGRNGAEEARDLAAGDYGQEDQDRGDLKGLPLYPGRQDVALQGLDQDE